MKKFWMFLLVATVALVGCKKDDEKEPDNNNGSQTTIIDPTNPTNPQTVDYAAWVDKLFDMGEIEVKAAFALVGLKQVEKDGDDRTWYAYNQPQSGDWKDATATGVELTARFNDETGKLETIDFAFYIPKDDFSKQYLTISEAAYNAVRSYGFNYSTEQNDESRYEWNGRFGSIYCENLIEQYTWAVSQDLMSQEYLDYYIETYYKGEVPGTRADFLKAYATADLEDLIFVSEYGMGASTSKNSQTDYSIYAEGYLGDAQVVLLSGYCEKGMKHTDFFYGSDVM